MLLLFFSLGFIVGCDHDISPLTHGEDHPEKSIDDDHQEGHRTGILEITSPIITDTLYYDEYVSQIRAFQHIELRAMERGYLQKMLVDEGEFVKKGQLLFVIQPTIYQAEMKKAQAELAQARAEKEGVLVEFRNIKALADSNIVSPNELALAQVEIYRADANVDNAVAEMELMKAHLQFTQIRAPFDGVIGRFEDIRIGSLIDEGEELTTLTDNSQLWVYFNVPESEYMDYVENKEEGQQLMLQLANHKLFEEKGSITAIESEFDNTTGTLPFRATFKNPKGLLRHGQTGNILWANHLKKAMVIPQKAAYEILEKRYVFVVDDAGMVSSHEIEIEAELDNLFVISSGLNVSDKFLIEGIRKVKNGDKIKFDYRETNEIYDHLNLHAE